VPAPTKRAGFMASTEARQPVRDWTADHRLWIEAFVLFNFVALVGDIFLAHSENHFRWPTEYVPLVFSVVAGGVLASIIALRPRFPTAWRYIGHLVGWLSVMVGLAGVLLHLDSQFFHERTLKSLTYAAPFAAPLAYVGLGLLLIANRMLAPSTREWAQWMLLLALGGFIGNFVFSLTDHAMNGFFSAAEWIPVVSSACAVGALVVPFVMEVDARYLRLCAAVLGLQALVGVAGFAFHVAADWRQPAASVFERILSGAPPLAPLLFPNLVVLCWIALWDLLFLSASTARDQPPGDA
jgi:hypothetical protein